MNSIKMIQSVMILTILFCLFVCPHSATAHTISSTGCSSAECHDLCNNTDHHENCDESPCVYDYRNNDSFVPELPLLRMAWDYISFIFPEPKHLFLNLDVIGRSSSHSFAIRQLDTIILRV